MEGGPHQPAPHVDDGPQEAEGNGGGGPEDLQNICRLMIDGGDGTTAEILFKGKLILHNSGPPPAAAAAGDAAPGNAALQGQSAQDAEYKEFLEKMRGWLLTVATLFVGMAFQAALHPPNWLHTTKFLRFSPPKIDRWKPPFHGASHAAVAPARSAPSPSPSPQAAEYASAGPPVRAMSYMLCNYGTLGSTLALVLALLQNKPSHRAKHILRLAKSLVTAMSLCVVGTVVLGTSEDWHFMLFAVFFIGNFACFLLPFDRLLSTLWRTVLLGVCSVGIFVCLVVSPVLLAAHRI